MVLFRHAVESLYNIIWIYEYIYFLICKTKFKRNVKNFKKIITTEGWRTIYSMRMIISGTTCGNSFCFVESAEIESNSGRDSKNHCALNTLRMSCQSETKHVYKSATGYWIKWKQLRLDHPNCIVRERGRGNQLHYLDGNLMKAS